MNEIIKPKQIKINKGDNNFNLSEFNEYGYDIEKVEFKPDNSNSFTFKLQKTGKFNSGRQIIYDSEYGLATSIPLIPFKLFRDGLIYLDLHSSVSGILYIHYSKIHYYQPTQEELEQERLKKEEKKEYYQQFFTLTENDNILLDEKIHNFRPHPDDEKICEFNKIYDKEIQDIKYEILMPRFRDIITEFEVESEKETDMFIKLTDTQYGDMINIKAGRSIYKTILPIRGLAYMHCYIRFINPEYIKYLKVNGVDVPQEIGRCNTPMEIHLNDKIYNASGGVLIEKM